MAHKYYTGQALAVPQITTLTVGGTPVATDTVYVEINRKRVTYTVGAAPTAFTVASGLYAAILALIQTGNAPEFAEITWSDPAGTSASFTGTSANSGQPFTLTVGATGTTTLGQTATQAATGPNHVSNAANWSSNSVPAGGDDITFPPGCPDYLYDIETTLDIALGTVRFLGGTGGFRDRTSDSPGDPSAYAQYRAKAVEIASATAIQIGDGQNAPDFLRLKITGATPTPIRVMSGAATSSAETIQLCAASGTSHTLTILGNSVALALTVGEVLEISALRVGTDGPDGSFGAGDTDPAVTIASGVTITAARLYGGTVRSDATYTGLTIIDGEWSQDGGTPGTVTATDSAGTYRYSGVASHGVITARGRGVTIDFSGDSRPFTLASGSSVTEGAVLYNPTRANAANFTIDKESLAVSEIGNSITITLTAA